MLEAVPWENPTYGISGGGGWKRGLRWNCEPTSQPKGRGWKPSAYGCARQCSTQRTQPKAGVNAGVNGGMAGSALTPRGLAEGS